MKNIGMPPENLSFDNRRELQQGANFKRLAQTVRG